MYKRNARDAFQQTNIFPKSTLKSRLWTVKHIQSEKGEDYFRKFYAFIRELENMELELQEIIVSFEIIDILKIWWIET